MGGCLRTVRSALAIGRSCRSGIYPGNRSSGDRMNVTIRVDSSKVEQAGPPADGGSIPTSTLQLRKKDWTVDGVSQEVARKLVEGNHYARGASNTFVALHGLYPRGWLWYSHCVGVAWRGGYRRPNPPLRRGPANAGKASCRCPDWRLSRKSRRTPVPSCCRSQSG